MLASTPREFGHLVLRALRPRRPLRRFALGIAMCLGLVIWLSGGLRADDEDEEDDAAQRPRPVKIQKDPTESSSSSVKSGSGSVAKGQQVSDGPGLDVSISANGGQGVVQDRPLLPLEAFPFALINDSLFFGDLRFYPTIDGTFGGSVGSGYRYYSHGFDRIFGASVWYDADGTRDVYFQQVGISLESYGKWVDVRGNVYLPVGETYQQSSQRYVNNSSRFVGENLVYDQLTNYLSAMRGFDMEAGVLLPGRFAEDHAIRVYAGGYYYNDEQGDNIYGVSGRVQANLIAGLDASVQVTNDNFFNTRAFFNVSWTYGPLHRSELSQQTVQGRFGERVTRNYTVLATSHSEVTPNIEAIDPSTHQPYVIAHVDSGAAAGGNGGVNSPFQTITAAQSSGASIIFVHANSVFHGNDATIVMNDGERLWGDGFGVTHSLAVSNLGGIPLPHGPVLGSLPVLDGSTGTSVALANNAELNGFTINNSAGAGIVANGVGGILLQNLTVNHAGTDGIQIANASGNSILRNVDVNNSIGNGLVINGGIATVRYDGSLSGSGGHDLLVENTGSGAASIVDMTNALFPGSGSQGILLQNVAGTVNFNNLSVGNTAGNGLEILGSSGNFNFTGTTTVSGAGAASILVKDMQATGDVTFGTLNINNRHDEGLVVNNSSGLITVKGNTTITNEGGTGASAIDVQNSPGFQNFVGNTIVTGTTLNPGVSLQNNTGTTSFTALNLNAVNGSGLSAINSGTLIINGAQTAAAGGTIAATNGTAIDIENTVMNVNLFSVSSSNAPAGIKLVGTNGSFAVFGDNHETAGSGGTLQGDSIGILLQNVGNVGLVSMNLNANGIGIQSQNVTFLGVTNTTIQNSTAYGISALDTKSLTVIDSNFLTNGSANIRAQVDQVGSYAYSFGANKFVSATDDNILLQSLAGGAGSTVNLIAQSNQFQNASFGTAGIDVNWNGTLSGTVSGNSFLVSGGTNDGLRVTNASTTGLTTVAFTNNLFTSEGGTDTALHVITAGSAQLNVASNGVQFGATSGTGFRFSLGGSSSVNINGNVIVDTTNGATGMQFDSITAPTNVVITGNTIQLARNGQLLNQGIIFSNVADVVSGGQTLMPTISGTQNNSIQGADTPFFVPVGTTNGQILINGTLMP